MDRMSWSMKPVCVVRVRMCESLCVCVCVCMVKDISVRFKARNQEEDKVVSFLLLITLFLSLYPT